MKAYGLSTFAAKTWENQQATYSINFQHRNIRKAAGDL
jgi:hypothetical protein